MIGLCMQTVYFYSSTYTGPLDSCVKQPSILLVADIVLLLK